MISYYELLLMISTWKQPYKILVPIEDVELLYIWNDNYKSYYVQPTTVSESFYKKYDPYLYNNIDEEDFFKQNIKVVSEYKFTIGEYVSYFDLLNAIKVDSQPYKVRYHNKEKYNDYVYDNNNYVEMEDTGDIPTWESHLSREVGELDIFEKNIEIIEAGNNMLKIKKGSVGSSYFNIVPVKVKDIKKDTNDYDNVIEYNDVAISIEEDDISDYLLPVLLKYFNDDLQENKKRSDVSVEHYTIGYDSSFEWYLTYNYYTFDDIRKIIEELRKIIRLLTEDYDNPYLDEIKKNYTGVLFRDNRINSNDVLENKDNSELIKNDINEIINFYKRFIDYLEVMLDKGEENGYNLISFMGP